MITPSRLHPALSQIAGRLTLCPTAPYHEHLLRQQVIHHLQDLPGVTLRLDRFGNLFAHYRHRPTRRTPFALVAHLDHPGFVTPQDHTALFLGGVRESCFAGQQVAFYSTEDGHLVQKNKIVGTAWTKKTQKVIFSKPCLPQSFGMWNLHPGKINGSRWISRNCDDLVGVITLVALLHQLSLQRLPGDVTILFTRAEEVGFHGALAALHAGTLPKDLPVISLETSKAQGFAIQGAGPIIRVGDRATIFDSDLTAWLTAAAATLQKKNKMPYQRLLMGGGTCEGTVFQQAGRPTAALCLALGNYHNMTKSGGIGPESVSVSDWNGLLTLLQYLVTKADSPKVIQNRFSRRVTGWKKAALQKLQPPKHR
jgi:putative aminopeptidase FrvX